jgi:hypothetical protein
MYPCVVCDFKHGKSAFSRGGYSANQLKSRTDLRCNECLPYEDQMSKELLEPLTTQVVQLGRDGTSRTTLVNLLAVKAIQW